MDNMDSLREHLDALEHQLHTLHQQSRAVQRRLRWWRGLASGVVVLGLLAWALPAVTADDAKPGDKKGLEQRVAALEQLLKHFSRDGKEIFITGANLHIRNGLGSTDCEDEQGNSIPDCPNRLGNLIVGYNEPRTPTPGGSEPPRNVRTGSHNVVVGQGHNFTRFGGLVVGLSNTISGDFASVSGGSGNTAAGPITSVSGGLGNVAGAEDDPETFNASISGGLNNKVFGTLSSISGGQENETRDFAASISGGANNVASGVSSSVSGGSRNEAFGFASSVSGGENNEAREQLSSVSGGENNVASGIESSISGGKGITLGIEHGWAAGSIGDEVSGSFRSP